MKELTKLLQKRFNEMCNTGTLYRSTVSGEELWEAWMKGFGNDPIFRSTESSVHNCNYCHSFFRQYGNLVALDNNLNLMTIWDIHTTLPEDNEYKIAIGLINIIDSIIKVLHIPLKKLVKVSDTVRGIVEPLLYNSGIPSYDAIMQIMPLYEGNEVGPQPEPVKKPDTVKDSKKGLPIILITLLLVILLFIPLLLLLLFGFVKNQIKYGKELK